MNNILLLRYYCVLLTIVINILYSVTYTPLPWKLLYYYNIGLDV